MDINAFVQDVKSLAPSELREKFRVILEGQNFRDSYSLTDEDIDIVIRITKILLEKPTLEAKAIMWDIGITESKYLEKLFLVIKNSDILQEAFEVGCPHKMRMSLFRWIDKYAVKFDRIFENLAKPTVPVENVVPPAYVDFFTTDSCFSKCLHCYNTEIMPDGKLRFIDTSCIPETLDENAAMEFLRSVLSPKHEKFELEEITFAGREPLAGRKGLTLRIIKQARELNKNLRIRVYTDGVGLEEPEELKIIAMDVTRVRISIDAATGDTWQRIHNSKKGNLQKVLNNVIKLVELRNALGSQTEIGVSFLFQKENYKELPEFTEKMSAMGLDFIDVLSIKAVEEKKSALLPDDKDEAGRILQLVQDKWKNGDFGRIKVSIEKVLMDGNVCDKKAELMVWEKAAKYCYISWLAPLIVADGNVLICAQRLRDKSRNPKYEYGKLPCFDFLSFWNKGEETRRKINPSECECAGVNVLLNPIIGKIHRDWESGISATAQPFRNFDPKDSSNDSNKIKNANQIT